MPDKDEVKEIYEQMVSHQREVLTQNDGDLRSETLLAAAYIVAALYRRERCDQ